MDVLGFDFGEEEGEEVGDEGGVTGSGHGLEGYGLAVGGGGCAEDLFDCFVFGFASFADGDGVDCSSEVGMDGFGITVVDAGLEEALGFCNDAVFR